MSNLTVIILTKNEAKNIREAVKNAQQCTAEILVIDSGSTDETAAIAKLSGARVVQRAWNNDFAAQRNFALQQATTEWVLYLDADERLNSDLAAQIKKVAAQNEQKQYLLLRKAVVFGQECNYGDMKPDYVPRLFPRKKVVWQGKVHELALCALPKETLTGFVKHYTYNDWNKYWEKFNCYTTLNAQKYYEQHKKAYFVRDLVFRPLWAFLRAYVIKLGFLDGKTGFIFSVNHGMSVMVKYTKLYYLQKGNNQ